MEFLGNGYRELNLFLCLGCAKVEHFRCAG